MRRRVPMSRLSANGCGRRPPGSPRSRSWTRASGGRCGRSCDALLVDWHVDEGRQDAERDGEEPHQPVGAGAVEEVSRDPDAEKAADLVEQEGDSGECREIVDPEDM